MTVVCNLFSRKEGNHQKTSPVSFYKTACLLRSFLGVMSVNVKKEGLKKGQRRGFLPPTYF